MQNFGAISDNFRLWSQISPERIYISNIWKKLGQPQPLTHWTKEIWWTLVPKQKKVIAPILTYPNCTYTVRWRKFIRHVVLGYCFSFASCHCCERNFEYLNWLSTRTCGAGRSHVWLRHAPLVLLILLIVLFLYYLIIIICSKQALMPCRWSVFTTAEVWEMQYRSVLNTLYRCCETPALRCSNNQSETTRYYLASCIYFRW